MHRHRCLGGDRAVPRTGPRDPPRARRCRGRRPRRRAFGRGGPRNWRRSTATGLGAAYLRAPRRRGRGGARRPRRLAACRLSMARFVFIGLSITSSWGNGHATTYRGLLKALARRGHSLVFAERDTPWYAANRDLPEPGFCRTFLYCDLPDLQRGLDAAVREADAVVVGSYV